MTLCYQLRRQFLRPLSRFENPSRSQQSRIYFRCHLFAVTGIHLLLYSLNAKGKTLEQVDWLFNNNVKLRHSGDTDASGMLDGSILDDVKASTYKRYYK